MFSDEEIKENSLMRPGDEIISIREVCLVDKYDKKYLGGETLLSTSGRNDLEVPRYLRDSLCEGLEARFAWTEEDGNIASLVSEPGFGSGTFGKSLDATLTSEIKEADTSFPSTSNTFDGKSFVEPSLVSSTSSGSSLNASSERSKRSYKVDKTDPRSRYHYVKYVKRHGRTVKLWECGICSREFQHQYTLMRHLPTHTDERNFHCDACAKSFRQLSTLSQHRAIHSAERPYACEVCNKTFNRVSTLISHRKTHSNEKPYRCHICPKGFHQKGNLRNHLFTHTNERPYRCNICMKGFNQQSNLVCHKNKAHPEENGSSNGRNVNQPRRVTQPQPEPQTDNRSSQQCEVTSSVGPYIPEPKSWSNSKPSWLSKPDNDIWNEVSWGNNGVIVDPINTYHMGVAIATRQTPFALLKSDTGTPVLVKVVDTKLPGGKQMLVPATAEDLRVGSKIILDNQESPAVDVQSSDANAVQIRVPVVATVVPKMKPGGRLQLSVEEPHHSYHSALPTDIGEVKVEPCTSPASNPLPDAKQVDGTFQPSIKPGRSWITPASPPLDLIPLDLFEPMGCIPLGPQITSVDIDQPPHSDDSDIFIGKFEESIPLTDSD
ncbi:uncharacterized protein LOC116774395 [Danaus plexippus]|uniref:uncharacterized protein LOC116774395 n=1 Tax=Danaus plexippus TaxID=13037 RepID=UPI0013C4946B|nr:uncharacterized protein LOC116774395 [Danaus plexippus]